MRLNVRDALPRRSSAGTVRAVCSRHQVPWSGPRATG
jgi:hypothetical protein